MGKIWKLFDSEGNPTGILVYPGLSSCLNLGRSLYGSAYPFLINPVSLGISNGSVILLFQKGKKGIAVSMYDLGRYGTIIFSEPVLSHIIISGVMI